jgi:hypothetical protein
MSDIRSWLALAALVTTVGGCGAGSGEFPSEAGLGWDGGAGRDTGSASDAGSSLDASSASDAGSGRDAASGLDARSGPDGGAGGDASTSPDTGDGAAGSSDSSDDGGTVCPLPTKFKWTSTGPLAQPKAGWVSLKNFSDVVFNNQHIVYYSGGSTSGAWVGGMMSPFTDWAQMATATQC